MAALALAFDILAKDHASATLKKVGDEVETTGKKGHGVGLAMGAGLAIAAGAVAEFGKKSIEAAIEGEAAHARLAQAIKNTGGSMEELEPKVNAMSDKFAKFGFTNDEVEAALAGMTASLGSSEKAMGAMGLAADLAKFKHIDLSSASLAVAKAMEGQLKPLKQLGIDLPVSAGGALKLEQAHSALAKAQEHVTEVLKQYPDAANAASKHHAQYEAATDKVTTAQRKLGDVQSAATEITNALSKSVGGQASAAAETYAGKVAAMHARMENLTEEIGVKLLPVMSGLITHLQSAIDFVQRNSAVMGPLIAAVAGLAAVVLSVNAAVKAWTAIQAALDVVLAANPIGLVVIAIAALVAGLILAYKHSATFRTIVKGAFDAVAEAVGFVVDKLGGAFGLLGHVPGFGWAKTASNALHDAADAARDLGDKVKGIPAYKHIQVDMAVNGINTATAALAKLGRLDGARATGGPVVAGGRYLVGERGPEVVTFGQAGYVSPNGQGMGGVHIEQLIVPPARDEHAAARAVTLALRMAQ